MKARKISPFFFILTIIVSITLNGIKPANAFSNLNLTVTTDKPVYDPRENVTIYGNLTQDGILVTDGLVGLEVKTPKGQTLITRILKTGTENPPTPYIRLWSVIPCNSTGGPKESFTRGALAYFKLTITNYDIFEPRQTLATVNTYYTDNTPFCLASFKANLTEGTTTIVVLSIPIPQDAPLGNSTVYGNAYTNWPSLGGTPHCEEVSANFLITSSGSYQSTTVANQNQPEAALQVNGNYNTTFLLPFDISGNYTTYVSSDYQGEKIIGSITFKVNLPGDVNDDGIVFWQDLLAMLLAYGSKEGDPNWDPRCDFNHDGIVFWQDLILVLINYGKSV